MFINNAAIDTATAPGTGTAATPLDVNQLFRTHRRHLLVFVRRYLRNEADAEDVVQATFVEALRCRERYSGLSKPSTWLFGIALNMARNQVRRNVTDKYEEVDDTFMEQLLDPRADPAGIVEARQITASIETLLAKLPAPIRETFEAVLDGDATYEQAAQQLNIPIGTVRSRVSRVRAAVRQQFGVSVAA